MGWINIATKELTIDECIVVDNRMHSLCRMHSMVKVPCMQPAIIAI